MATITSAGIEPDSLQTWIDEVGQVFRNALGEDLSLDSATPQGQLIRQLALTGVKLDELAVHVAAGLNLYQGRGRQLTDYATLMGIPFRDGTRSTVTATLTGDQGTLIPAGARVRTTGGSLFRLDEQVIIPAAETITALFRADQVGAITAPANSLTSIVDAIPGWTGCTNAAAAEVGRAQEPDADWVLRYVSRVAIHGVGTHDAILARVLDVDGVSKARVLSNSNTSAQTVDSFSIAANSVAVIVVGGVTADIAEAIHAVLAPGMAMTGNVTHSISPNTIRFTRANRRNVEVRMRLTITEDFPPDGEDQIVENLLQYIERHAIGEDLDLIRIQTTATDVLGHTVTEFTVQADGRLLGTTGATDYWVISANDINITLSV